jgi:hypothetical protein
MRENWPESKIGIGLTRYENVWIFFFSGAGFPDIERYYYSSDSCKCCVFCDDSNKITAISIHESITFDLASRYSAEYCVFGDILNIDFGPGTYAMNNYHEWEQEGDNLPVTFYRLRGRVVGLSIVDASRRVKSNE